MYRPMQGLSDKIQRMLTKASPMATIKMQRMAMPTILSSFVFLERSFVFLERSFVFLERWKPHGNIPSSLLSFFFSDGE
ncbi:MAG: hypothetical protein ACOC32_04110 [Nanoarchaeota archaeon]